MGVGCSCNRKSLKGWPAGNDSEYMENMVREVPVNSDETVLVVKSEGIYHCIGSRCTYCNATLVQGVVTDGKIITCPWHKASFDLTTGDIDDFPGLDSLPIYKISQEVNGALTVYCPDKLKPRGVRPIHKWKNNPTFVIIGAGPTAFMAAQTLCQNGFDGKIIMLTKDGELPFDKTQLSKDLNPQLFRLELKDFKYYQNYDIELRFLTEVTKVNFKQMVIHVKGTDKPISYDKLLIASGSQTSKLSGIVEGGGLKNILSLNNYKGALELFSSLQPGRKTFVIIGGTFLGLEIATMIAALCAKVIIIGNRSQPLDHIIGPAGSSIIMQSKDFLFPHVKYIGPEEITSFRGNDLEEVTHVVTAHHGSIPCDTVILAMNPKPNTSFLSSTDLVMNMETGAVVVDRNMETSIRNVFAAGDVAVPKCSLDCYSNLNPKGQSCTSTWNVAVHQGKVAALNMLDISSILTTTPCVPFFWSKMFGVNIKIVGPIKGADEIIVYSKCNSSNGRTSMCSLFRLNSRIIGAMVTSDCDPLASLIASDLRSNRLTDVLDTPPYITARFPEEPIREKPGNTNQIINNLGPMMKPVITLGFVQPRIRKRYRLW